MPVTVRDMPITTREMKLAVSSPTATPKDVSRFCLDKD